MLSIPDSGNSRSSQHIHLHNGMHLVICSSEMRCDVIIRESPLLDEDSHHPALEATGLFNKILCTNEDG